MTARRLVAGSAAASSATLLLAGCAPSSDANEVSTPPPIASSTRAPTPDEDAQSASYRDGEYAATGWYGGLPSHHDVTLTIEDDIVTAVSVSTPAQDPTSLGYQRAFAAAVPGVVIGQHIDNVSVERLAGASGCPEGFMDALEQIKADAAGS
jgi:hypothetical protein